MKNKFISTKSNVLLSYFDEQVNYCFDYTLAYMVFLDAKTFMLDWHLVAAHLVNYKTLLSYAPNDANEITFIPSGRR